MNEVLRDAIYFILSYLIVLVIGFLIIQFLSNGFFSKFLTVKASRRQKVLVQVVAVGSNYFAIGRIDEGFLNYKNRKKDIKRVAVNKGDVFEAIGVLNINVDDLTNAVIRPDGSTVSGFDAVKMEELYLRALMRPPIKNVREQLKDVIFQVLILAGVVFTLFRTFQLEEILNSIQTAIGKIGGVI